MADVYDVVVIGAGAAGIGAGRRLAKAGVSFLIVEARARAGGRAWTAEHGGHPLDLGAGWLHSADRNVMVAIGESLGFTINRTEAPWQKQTAAHGMSADEQAAFGRAFSQFEARIDLEAEADGARAASFYLEPDGRWNALINAVFSYISGAALDEIDARDYARYEDTGRNWRAREGYGALIAACARGLPIWLECEARAIDHAGASLRIATTRGDIEAKRVIVTVPPWALSQIAFTPTLQEKIALADSLPLGAAEKLYFTLAQPEEFPADGHLFARTDAVDTGSYHLRPMGRPLIEVYFGGALARGLAEAGSEAMSDFAKQELAALLGASFPARLTTLAASAWTRDPWARGSYSFARPGAAEARAQLAAPHEGRLFFAGEATSRARYSTVHGAFETGYDAAEAALLGLPA